ncbi:DNA-binding response regulator [Paenibacillus marchantiophytorum]|uniref:DNA-binding response regulator n=1 Tax=Paenibacillus marchantiophytorum TaxID=1619310 RepID=A0ABQ2BQ37_9BACL|nr:response regulator transcription factor [Paenibacillus marchantiophytorum]GGI44925.1 DNA-binding response regulator [Paenibacillus marchantiophytorum]
MNDARILLVDDEQSILELLQTVLRKEGFLHLDTAKTGEMAVAACEAQKYDLIVLDVMLPGRSGIEVCPFIKQTTDAPILFLTARSSDLDKLTGFVIGGDDYITKPFNPLEVVARIRAQLRRYYGLKGLAAEKRSEVPGQRSANVFDYGRFKLDELAGELVVEGQAVSCPALVFQLLLYLCKNPNRIFSKSELYEKVWGEEALSDDNTVMVHIHRARERIEADPSNPKYLINVRGLGYKLVKNEQQEPATP